MRVLPPPSEQWVCRHCKSVAIPDRRSRGSAIIAIVLFFFFIIPGLIYTIWMLEKGEAVCPRCGSKDSMIPVRSPEGMAIVRDPDRLPAGWYGDPSRRFDWRYWDGSAWTERVWLAGREFVRG